MFSLSVRRTAALCARFRVWRAITNKFIERGGGKKFSKNDRGLRVTGDGRAMSARSSGPPSDDESDRRYTFGVQSHTSSTPSQVCGHRSVEWLVASGQRDGDVDMISCRCPRMIITDEPRVVRGRRLKDV